MRNLTKLLVLVLSLALLVGAVFAVAAFAAEDDGLTIEGARRTHIDFTGKAYDYHNVMNGSVAATPQTNEGTAPIGVSVKYGHMRTVTTPDGNTWFEWLFEEEEKYGAENHDSYIHFTNNLSVAGLGYYIQEYDITTRTDFPGNLQIFAESRVFNGSSEYVKNNYRGRNANAKYNASTGVWEGGDAPLTLKANEWAHITLITKLVPEYSTVETEVDGEKVSTQMVNYAKSETKMYVNGEYFSTMNFFVSTPLPADLDFRIYYMGLGYAYGNQHVGTQADDGVVVDNVAITTIPSAYAADVENDKLAPLFAAENPATTLAGAGEAVVYNANYKLPKTEPGVAAYVNVDEEYFVAATIEKALQEIKDNEDDEAVIQLYANRYWPVHIDYPVTIDLNGFALQNGYTCSSDLVATVNLEDGTITFAYDLENSATFNYYLGAYGATGEVVKTVIVAPGNAVDKALLAGKVSVTVNGKVGTAPTGEFKIYDENGVEVTIDAIGEENKGKVYSVCPVLKTETLENNIAFYATVNGAVTFYDNDDIQTIATGGVMPANVKIVLVTDCVYSKTIYAPTDSTFTLDLNGNKLSAKNGAAIKLVGPVASSAKNVDYFIYTSKDGAVIETNRADNLIENKGWDSNFIASYFFGYSDADTKATGRMTINFGKMVCYMNKRDLDSIKFYNAELHTYGSWALFEMAQARMDYILELDTCDAYCDGSLVYAGSNSTNCDLTIKNSNIYGTGKGIFTDPAGNAAGSRDVILINSKIYNFEVGNMKIASFSMDETSMVSCQPTMKNSVAGKIVLCKPEVVTINGTNYFTGYQWVPADTQYATFNFYNMPKSEVTADTPVTSTLTVAVGGWWGRGGAVGGKGVYYNPELDPNNAFATLEADVVYDAEGNRVTKTALEASDAGKVFTVCVDSVIIEDEKVPVYAYVALANGKYLGLTQQDIAAALMAETGSNVLPEGSTLVLLTDCCLNTGALYIGAGKIDLNGKTLYYVQKGNGHTLYVNQANPNFFLYSSKPGARLCATPTTGSGSAYVVEVRSAGSRVYFGYVDENTMSPYTIDVFGGAFFNAQGANDIVINVANIRYAAVGPDNYGIFNVRGGGVTDVTYNLNNVTVYVEGRSPLFCLREANGATFNAKNSNLYFNNGTRSLAHWYALVNEGRTGSASMNLEDTNVVGNIDISGLVLDQAVITVTLKGKSTISAINENIKPAEGYAFLPGAKFIVAEEFIVPSGGKYGAKEYNVGGMKLWYHYTLTEKTGEAVDTEAFKNQVFQNMTLDTNVVLNLYIPAQENVYEVVLDGNQYLLDKNNKMTIGGKEYYVLSIEKAPKYGNAQANVVVYFENGDNVALPISVAYYAKALFALDGTNNAYVADSQAMMKYVLTYIREVAAAMLGTDEETIFADLGDYYADINLPVTEEVKDATAIKTYVTDAALNLDAYAGFAFKVAAGFVGTIRVELPGVPAVEKTYEEAAGENEVIVLADVPAYLFRGTVTITVTPAEGEVAVGEFNLATYVNALENKFQFVRAFYSYTVEAANYKTKYPNINTVN